MHRKLILIVVALVAGAYCTSKDDGPTKYPGDANATCTCNSGAGCQTGCTCDPDCNSTGDVDPCPCDTNSACQLSCACDPDCFSSGDDDPCACDTDFGCQASCWCDPDCSSGDSDSIGCTCDTSEECDTDCSCDMDCLELPTSAQCTETVSSLPAAYDGVLAETDTSVVYLGDTRYFDGYCVTLAAGQTLTAETSAPTSGDPLDDSLLLLTAADGTYISQNDDGGTDRYSLLVFTADTAGTYVVSVGGYDETYLGGYHLTIDVQ